MKPFYRFTIFCLLYAIIGFAGLAAKATENTAMSSDSPASSILLTSAKKPVKALETLNVIVFAKEPSALFQELSLGFKNSLNASEQFLLKEQFVFWDRQSDWQTQLKAHPNATIISIGQRSFEQLYALQLANPTFYTWIELESLQKLQETNASHHFALGYEQPLIRYFALIKAMGVFQSKTGVVIHHNSRYKKHTLSEMASFFDLAQKTITSAPEYSGRDAIEQLKQCCNIMLLPTSTYKEDIETQRAVILNSTRNRLVSIVSTPSLLQEGAMLSLHSRPYHIGTQATKMLLEQHNNTLSNRYQRPERFSLQANRNVARLLGYHDLSLGRLMPQIATLEFLNRFIGKTP